MHDPDGSTPKPASTWGNAARVALHNVYYRTPATPGGRPVALVAGVRAARCSAAPSMTRSQQSYTNNYSTRQQPNRNRPRPGQDSGEKAQPAPASTRVRLQGPFRLMVL